MPASITTDLVVSSPKVAGKRMLMPESGPMPGSTPTIVPTRHPRKAYHSTSGCSATENPSSRLSSVPIALESEQPERLVERDGGRGDDDHPQRVRQVGPCQARDRRALAGARHQHQAEQDERR